MPRNGRMLAGCLSQPDPGAAKRNKKGNAPGNGAFQFCWVNKRSTPARPPKEDFFMKMLLSTTALVLVLGLPSLALAQVATPSAGQTRTQQTETMPGFLATRGQSDLLASDLIGHEVHARRTASNTARTSDKANTKADETRSNAAGASDKANTKAEETRSNPARSSDKTNLTAEETRGMQTMSRTDLDSMDNIGKINDIVLSRDGKVLALVIGVGGFLGMGERDVAVTMDQVTFASASNDRSQMYIVVNTGADVLKRSPAYDRTSMTTDGTVGKAGTRDGRLALAAPQITRDGYDRVKAKEVSTGVLTGKSVFDAKDNDVGTVTDMIVDDTGAITDVIIDFGGFLGLVQNRVSIGFDELTILSTKGYSDVRVYVDATKQQIQDRPRYQAKK